MNERIKELERQAEKFVMGIPASLDINEYTSVFNEKFAELLMKECADYVDSAISDGGVDGRSLKEHFGVEE